MTLFTKGEYVSACLLSLAPHKQGVFTIIIIDFLIRLSCYDEFK